MYVDYIIYHPDWNVLVSEKETLLITCYNSGHKPGLSCVTSEEDHPDASHLFTFIFKVRRDDRKKHGHGQNKQLHIVKGCPVLLVRRITLMHLTYSRSFLR